MGKRKSEKEKKHSFSIWLLKEAVSPEILFSEKLKQKEISKIDVGEPSDAIAYIWKNEKKKKRTWWQEYWEIQGESSHILYNAIVFVPIADRWFAITHGYAGTYIKDEFIETRFAYHVALNALDPTKLATTKTFQPTNSVRQLTQRSSGEGAILPSEFGITSTSILQNLAGKVLPQYTSLFSSVSGGSGKALKMKAQTHPREFKSLLQELLKLSKSKEYLVNFPDALKIELIEDQTEIQELDKILENEWKKNNQNIQIDIPDIIDTFEWIWSIPSIRKHNLSIDDFTIQTVMEVFQNSRKEQNFETFKKMKIEFRETEDSISFKQSDIYSCLSFDYNSEQCQNFSYFLVNGSWYKVEKSFLSRLDGIIEERLLKKSLEQPFPPFSLSKKNSEYEYNKLLAEKLGGVILDHSNISPRGQTQVEPCDVLVVDDNQNWFIHSKIFRSSSCLSHLFNQGYVSTVLIKQSQEALTILENLVEKENPTISKSKTFSELIETSKPMSVVFCIIAKENRKAPLSLTKLPLFSKISLKHIVEQMRSLDVGVAVKLVEYEEK